MKNPKKFIRENKNTESIKINSYDFNAIKILDYLKNNKSDHILISKNKCLISGTEFISITSNNLNIKVN